MEHFLWFLLMGLVIGWLAGVLTKGSGFGIVGDIAVGVLGSLLGGWLAGVLGVSAYSSLGSFLVSLLGAVALLGLLRLITRRSPPA